MMVVVAVNLNKMKHLLIYVLTLCFWTSNAQKMNHSEWTNILQLHVSDAGKVDYKGFLNNRESLDNYLANLGRHAPKDHWSTSEKKAYWINAYNAFTIQLILNNYPVKSIKKLSDPWGQKFILIDGKMMSLNTIEHEILRPMGDSRIHFAIVCASESCPKLSDCAFEAKTLNDQLDQAAHDFINAPSKNNLAPATIKISKIFKWFKADFPKGNAFITYLNNYSTTAISPQTKIEFLSYNWALND